MRVFITGATGFVGRHVMEKIHASGHDILASTLEEDKTENNPSNIHWLNGDLADLELLKAGLKSFNPDVVIHLAWQGIPDYSESISRINLINSIDLLDCIMNNKPAAVNFDDGRNALIVANGALESYQSGKFIKINY